MPSNTTFTVKKQGMLATIQDAGRFKQAQLGITSGGPADKHAYLWANRLLNNDANAATIEISFGGVELEANGKATIAITGAKAPIAINNKAVDAWRCLHVKQGDKISIGFANQGCRIYLAVSGGFNVPTQFGSCSTVLREKLGGIDGQALKAGQTLKVNSAKHQPLLAIEPNFIPEYSNNITVRVITGYQINEFNQAQINKFFTSEYTVSPECDRMGYRLTGPKISSNITAMYSEGICLGAIQIPPSGEPIVLGNDRQTIGGYPKIGSALSLDLNHLMQCTQGAKIHFEPITIHCAHNLLHLAKMQYKDTPLIKLDA